MTGWTPDVSAFPNGFNVNSLTVGNGLVYASGNFGVSYNVTQQAAAFNQTTGALDTSWAPTITQSNPNLGGSVFQIAVAGSDVDIAGGFSFVDGVARNNIAQVDGQTGAVTAWNPDSQNGVGLISQSASTVYVTNDGAKIGGKLPNGFMSGLSASTGAATRFNPMINVNLQCCSGGGVSAILATSKAVFAAGWFDRVNDGLVNGTRVWAGRNDLAALSPTSGLPTAWPAMCAIGNGYSPAPAGALAASASNLYIGGTFTNLAYDDDPNGYSCTAGNWGPGGLPRQNLAAFNVATGMTMPFAPRIGGPVQALATSGGTLIVGGYFASVDGNPREGLVLFNGA